MVACGDEVPDTDTDTDAEPVEAFWECGDIIIPALDLGTAVGDGVATGTIVNAENYLDASCGDDASGDAVFLWTAPQDGYYIPHLSADFNAVLVAFNVATCAEEACEGLLDTSHPVFAGTQFAIVVTSLDGSEGDFEYGIDVLPPVPWDDSVGAGECASVWPDGLSPCDEQPDEYLVVDKRARNLALCDRGGVVANYNIGLSYQPEGDKEHAEDVRTPEGTFYIAKVAGILSDYEGFEVSYPDAEDADRGLAEGLIDEADHADILAAQDECTEPPQDTALGGFIYVHDDGGGLDWTDGCVAVDDDVIVDLRRVLGIGDTVVILPGEPDPDEDDDDAGCTGCSTGTAPTNVGYMLLSICLLAVGRVRKLRSSNT